jgi:hypothetical protein
MSTALRIMLVEAVAHYMDLLYLAHTRKNEE